MSFDSRMTTVLSFEIPLDCGNVSYSCLTDAHFVLAPLTMVFGFTAGIYLLRSVSPSGISVRVVSARCLYIACSICSYQCDKCTSVDMRFVQAFWL